MSNPEQRARLVLQVKDIKTARRMMSALSSDLKDYNRAKDYGITRDIEGIKTRLQQMRSMQRDRDADPLLRVKSIPDQEADKIRYKIKEMTGNRKFKTTTNIGGKNTAAAEYEKAIYGSKSGSYPTVNFYVGYMWYRKVYDNLYTAKQDINPEYLVLAATEYRTNVPHIRLYEAVVYSFKEKKGVAGWIGQSKLGRQPWSFRTDKSAAIAAGQRLTVGSVNQQISGETNG